MNATAASSDMDLNTMKQDYTIKIPTTFQSPLLPSNLPCLDLHGIGEDYFNICVPLYEASITGDWEAAKLILDTRPELVRFAITDGYDTALHVATSVEETKLMECFVENLVNWMTKEDLELQNRSLNTAVCLAAAAGNVKMVSIMVNKNPNLLNVSGAEAMLPLYMSALHGKYETVKYLYGRSRNLTGDLWTRENRGLLLLKCVESDLFDVALKIVKDHPELAMNGSVLGALARKPDAFAFDGANKKILMRIINSIWRIDDEKSTDSDALELLKFIWRNTIKRMSKGEVDDILKGPPDEKGNHPSRILFVAVEMGNARFAIELLRVYPDLMWKTNDDNYSIFHVAVMNRCHDIYNLLYEIGTMKDLIMPYHDRDGNNMLHLVGKTSVKMRSRAFRVSFLMQRELLWFMEIEKMMPPSLRERKNNDGKTPHELFSEENMDLVSQGLKWAEVCMLVSTLIVTIAFGVAFTIPGGYNQESGIPNFIHESSFLVFVIADAMSLIFSLASLLTFLFILTFPREQRVSMYTLPKQLMVGLSSLLISIAALMVTFSASFYVLYRNKLKWIPILIAANLSLPVISALMLKFPLLMEVFRSMYNVRYLFNTRKYMLYNRIRRF